MLSDTPVFFSLIIPTFNSEAHLQECLESINRQQFRDFEVLVVDGESTDDTLPIIKRMMMEMSTLSFISEKDKGVYDAMNKGIKLAKGSWLYFLGSDDRLFDQQVLRRISDHTKDTAADVIYGNVMLSPENEIYAGEFDANLLYAQNISHQAIFFKRHVFQETGYFDLQYRSNADWDHNFKWFFSKSLKNKHVDVVVAVYSQSGLSSWYVDKQFREQKNQLFLKSGSSRISEKFKAAIYKSLAGQARKDGNNLKFAWFSGLFILKTITSAVSGKSIRRQKDK